MKNNILFKGIMPALPTPVDNDEKLVKKAYTSLLDFDIKGGVNGFYVCGATGEGPALPTATRMEALETVIDHCKGKNLKVIAHVGGADFCEVKKLAKHAAKSGADAVSSMAPNAYYSHNDRETIDYYKAIAEISEIPLLVYVTPMLLGNNLEAVFQELMSVPNIIGMKFTLPNYYLLTRLKMINGGNINVINGPDEMLLAGLSMGADGGIGSTYNVMPQKYTALYDAFKKGEIDKAREIQYAINKIVYVLIKNNNCIASIKEALEMFGIEGMGSCVFPKKPFTAEEAATLRKELKEAGLEI